MPDNVLKVGAEFDVGPIVDGAKDAVSAFDRFATATIENAKAQAILSSQIKIIKEFQDDEIVSTDVLAESLRRATAAAAELAAAKAALGLQTRNTTDSLGGFERAAALAGGRILGMEAGLGMAGGALARVASFLPGLGTLFVYAFPVALVSEIVDKIEQYEKALQKADREVKELAISSNEMTDTIEKENLKLEDQILKLEHRPAQNTLKIGLIEAQEAADKLSKSIQTDIEKAEDLLNVGIGGALFSLFTGGGRADEAQYAAKKVTVDYAHPDVKKSPNDILSEIQDVREKQSALPAGASSEQINAGLKEQIELYKQLKVALESAQREMEAGGTDLHAKSIARVKEEIIGVSDAIKNLGLQEVTTNLTITKSGLEDYAAHIKTIEDQVGKVAALNTEINETREHIAELSKQPILNASAITGAQETLKSLETELDKAMTSGFAKSSAEIAKSDAMWKKFWADRDADAIKSAAEQGKIAEEASKRWMELMDHTGEQVATRNIEKARAEATTVEEIFRKMQEQRDTAATGHAGIFLDVTKTELAEQQMKVLDVQITTTDETIKRLQADVAVLNRQPFVSEGDQKQIQRYADEIKTLEGLLQRLQTEHQKLGQVVTTVWQDIHKAEEQAVSTFFTTFNSQFVRMMETGQSFSKVMISAWNSMVGSFVTAVLKMGEQWVATEILKLTTTQTTNAAITANTLSQNLVQRFDSAKTAAAKAMASVGFPLDLAVGPLVFAAALAFEKGGVVPGMGAVPAIVHGGERVLTSSQNTTLERIANSTTNNSGSINMENHFHGNTFSADQTGRELMRMAKRGKLSLSR